jgi:hypothetical protein
MMVIFEGAERLLAMKWLALIATSLMQAGTDSLPQSFDDYRAAINKMSTLPTFVMVTVTDRRSNASQIRCVPANLLLGAIHYESGLSFNNDGIQSVKKIALSSIDRRFTFENRKALRNVGFGNNASGVHDERACDIIRKGHVAVQLDLTGETVDMTLHGRDE